MAKVGASLNFNSRTIIISAILVTIITKQLKVSDQVTVDVIACYRTAIQTILQ